MGKRANRLLALLMSAVLCVSNIPVHAADADDGRVTLTATEESGSEADGGESGLPSADAVDSGDFGEGNTLHWALSDGVLTISGTGRMENFEADSRPWESVLDSITEVKVEDGVTRVGKFAFMNAKALKKLTLADSVKQVGGAAFGGCSALEEVDLGKGLVSLGYNCFTYTTALKSIVIPGGVKMVPHYAFNGGGLEEITLAEGVEAIGYQAFPNTLKKLCIPTTLKSIANSACSGKNGVDLYLYYGGTAEEFENVVIADLNDRITTINLVTECDKVVTDRSAVPAAAKVAEGSCGELGWTLDDEGLLTFSGSGDMPDYLADTLPGYEPTPWNAYKDSIVTVRLEEGVGCVGDYAFDVADAIQKVILADSVKRIGRSAFDQCLNLYAVELGSGLRSIDPYAFLNCDGMASITIPGRIKTISESAFSYCRLGRLVLEEGVQTIEGWAFQYANLTHVELPLSLKSIGDAAFRGNPNLKAWYAGTRESFEKITIGSGNENLTGAEIVYGEAAAPAQKISDVRYDKAKGNVFYHATGAGTYYGIVFFEDKHFGLWTEPKESEETEERSLQLYMDLLEHGSGEYRYYLIWENGTELKKLREAAEDADDPSSLFNEEILKDWISSKSEAEAQCVSGKVNYTLPSQRLSVPTDLKFVQNDDGVFLSFSEVENADDGYYWLRSRALDDKGCEIDKGQQSAISNHIDVQWLLDLHGNRQAFAVSAYPLDCEAYRNSEWSEWIIYDNGTVKKAVPVTKVTMEKTSLSVEPGKVVTIQASVAPETSTCKTVEWSSSDPSVCKVESFGDTGSKAHLKGLKAGSVTITAKAIDGSGVSATMKVTVTTGGDEPGPGPGPVDPDPISGGGGATDSQPAITDAAEQSLVLVKGQKFTLAQKDWTSSDKTVLAVSKGNVTAKKAGSATLKSEKQTITVTVVEFAIDKKDKTISLFAGNNGMVTKLTDLLADYNEGKDASAQLSATYQSLAPDVATVGEDGSLTAVSKGSAVINAYVNGVVFKFTVKVADADTTKPPFGEGEASIWAEPMQSYQIKAAGFNAKKAKYSSDNENAVSENALKKGIAYEDNVVRITTSGKLTAIGVGETRITTTGGGKDFVFNVTVEEPRAKTLHLNVKGSKTLKMYGTKGNLNWKAYDPEDPSKEIKDVVGIKGNTIKGSKTGHVLLQAECEGFTYFVDAYVEDPSLEIKGELKGKPTSAKWEAKPGESLTIIQPGVSQEVLFTSNKCSVAYVDEDGVIHARSAGKAKITAKVNGKTVTITVTVN
ncbi:MAG: leucine-rich repeat protein [Lachnospiraceae bacterium]|nr:leucine-rich repeat protein [Lachnospiraceae bacterium]